MALREINLIPAEVIHKKCVIRHMFLWAGGLALSLSLIAGFYLYQVRLVLPGKRPATTLEDIHSHLGTTIEEIGDTQQEIQRLSLQETFIKKLTRFQPFSSQLLSLSDIINTQTWLTRLTIETHKEEIDEEPTITLDGYSLSHDDLGNLLTQLSVAPMFTDVVLKYADEALINPSFQGEKAFYKVVRFQIDYKITKIL
jgi:Tfp pilus assembly protein PilN